MGGLAEAAGTALVTAMATDGWRSARAGVVALWRKVRPEHVPAIEAELEDVHNELVNAQPASEEAVKGELVVEWRRKLQRLLAQEPHLAEDLQEIMNDYWQPLLSKSEKLHVQNITMTADVKDEGRAYMAAGDQHFHEDRPPSAK